MVSEELVEELKAILREEYGRDITTAEAAELARQMVGYFDLLTQIHHRGTKQLQQ